MSRTICLIGVSGAGKTTLVAKLQELYPDKYHAPVSMTTRSQRDNEVNGVDYHFVSQEMFDLCVEQGLLAEHASYNNNSYGTPFSELQVEGKVCLHVVEDAGALALRDAIGAEIVAIIPPSLDEAATRLELRGDKQESIEQRKLTDMGRESVISDIADYEIHNDQDLSYAANQLHQRIEHEITFDHQSL